MIDEKSGMISYYKIPIDYSQLTFKRFPVMGEPTVHDIFFLKDL